MRKKKTSDPLVSVVILNWNGLEDTLRCIDSVRNLNYANIEIVLVDNGSKNDAAKLEKLTSPGMKLIKNKSNLGFAGGQVSALPHCSGDFILLLNNDAVIDKDSVKKALETFDADPKIAAVGGRTYPFDKNKKNITFYAHQWINPVTADVITLGVDNQKTEDVITVSGSCVFIRKSAIDNVGYFDERFFAYYEESDLFARFLRAGWRIVYNPAIIAYHKDRASTKDKQYMYYYLMLKNQFLFAYKNFSKTALQDFKKTYYRNFRRSLWLYLRNGSQETIHKARVMSTLWNLRGLPKTLLIRKKSLANNPAFDYNKLIISHLPLPITIVIDANGIERKKITKTLKSILSLSTTPSEILVITKQPVKMPDHSSYIRVENIIDRGLFELSAYDYGLMCSNNDILVFWNNEIDVVNGKVSDDLFTTFRLINREECGAIVAGNTVRRQSLDITRKNSLRLTAIKKTDFVEYINNHSQIASINSSTLGHYINWLTAHCKPIFSAPIRSRVLCIPVSPNASVSDIRLIKHSLIWHMKNIVWRSELAKRFAAKAKRVVAGLLRRIKARITPHAPSNGATSHAPTRDLGQFYLGKDTPIIINTRDRYEPLLQLISWLKKAGHNKIAFVDNQSTYPPLVSFFRTSPYQCIPLGRNGMHKAPWESFAVRFIAKNKYYVVSDPDIIPVEACPDDVIDRFKELLEKYPDIQKVGFGLKIDDIPNHYPLKKDVILWESRFWDKKIEIEKDVYRADIDTTFALYRPGTWWCLGPSLRTGGKLVARHEPWYINPQKITNDALYYKIRSSDEVTTWGKDELPAHHLRALKKEGLL